MTDPTTQLTEMLLQDLLKTVSTLQNDILELKKADIKTNRDTSRKRPHNDEPSSSKQLTCNGEDDTSQLSDKDGSDGDPTSDVKEHISSDTAEHFKPSEVYLPRDSLQFKDGIFYEEGEVGQVRTMQLQVDQVSRILLSSRRDPCYRDP